MEETSMVNINVFQPSCLMPNPSKFELQFLSSDPDREESYF